MELWERVIVQGNFISIFMEERVRVRVVGLGV